MQVLIEFFVVLCSVFQCSLQILDESKFSYLTISEDGSEIVSPQTDHINSFDIFNNSVRPWPLVTLQYTHPIADVKAKIGSLLSDDSSLLSVSASYFSSTKR